uniref:photosystem I reaction center subunit III (plastocyanin-binding) n=1 Tax=Hypnea pseudomusciformis TaxID=1545697 RepID=UPI0027DAA4D5|nr:photosystem I reaction center subunit III (plastocyanin-binding) [Hypnea pseudomusciformis]WCH55060.1 photosystem I reaction center subunit III (plastocyanin-binding) [Hypnea pseudomusciformis]WCH55459.1 photosystem I reaction center subunit III (plastocyanin-binding) [Hypnea pseudomusciformis]WCH56653.1 photosystem I reaction center subunit III (plastocyanin-binding) [Hypnea pseudomusciformis]
MKQIFAIIWMITLITLTGPINTFAEISNLQPCKNSPAFIKRLNNSIKKLETRMQKYDPTTPPALAIQEQIKKTQIRFDKYSQSGILCGTDGLPHLITDGRWNHAGEFMAPGLLFIYITGWIGWVGRKYIQAISTTSKPTEKEIILDVPLALKFSVSGFTWPLEAIKEFTNGQLLANDNDITVSPR